MIEQKHTPGPWITDYTGYIWGDTNNPIWDGDFPLIAQVLDAKNCTLPDANARLIAHAPELLEVMENVIKWVKENTVLTEPKCLTDAEILIKRAKGE